MSKDSNADFNGHYLNGKTKTNKNYPGGGGTQPDARLGRAGTDKPHRRVITLQNAIFIKLHIEFIHKIDFLL